MRQRGYGLRFAFEARQRPGVEREVAGDDLDRHVPREPAVVCAIDHAHAARPERLDDLVRTEPGAAQQGH